MPKIIDYSIVLERMEREGFRSLYHNSGAFGFVDEAGVESVGWIGGADETLKPAARLLAELWVGWWGLERWQFQGLDLSSQRVQSWQRWPALPGVRQLEA